MAAKREAIEQQIASVERELATSDNPFSVTVRSEDGQLFGGSLALQMLRDKRDSLSPSAASSLRPLAYLQMVCGALAALIGAGAITLVGLLGRRACVSRDALLRNFSEGTRLLPWVLVCNAGLMQLGLVCLVGFELMRFFATGEGEPA